MKLAGAKTKSKKKAAAKLAAETKAAVADRATSGDIAAPAKATKEREAVRIWCHSCQASASASAPSPWSCGAAAWALLGRPEPHPRAPWLPVLGLRTACCEPLVPLPEPTGKHAAPGCPTPG